MNDSVATAGQVTATSDSLALHAEHRMKALLAPKSIALVGASPREGSVGKRAAESLLDSGFTGPITFVNPRHERVLGKDCLDRLSDLESPPDLVILNLGAARLEAGLTEAISVGVRSAVIFDACQGEAKGGQPLRERLRELAREANLPVCGGNGMGFFNIPQRCHASFYSAKDLKAGGITLIAHSGSVFTVLALNDPRYRFDLAVSPGLEIGATLDEYVDFALTRSSTKVIALFLEGVRKPEAFAAALAKAQAQGKTVIACKVGRTDESAALALSHSGTMAGSNEAFEALLARHGAIAVKTVDQLMNLAMLLATGREMAAGELATVTDSGGLRELFIDQAKARDLPLATLSPETRSRLQSVLPPGLPASNPLDCAAALDAGFVRVFEDGLATLAAAPEVGVLGFEIDARDDLIYAPGLGKVAETLPQVTSKPCFLYNSFARAHNRGYGDLLADLGVPLLNGLDETLSAVAALRRLRDLKAELREQDPPPPAPAAEIVAKWKTALKDGSWLGERDALALLRDFAIASVACIPCANEEDLRSAATELDYPLVLKTAARGLTHKSDQGGVVTGIASREALESAYREMAARLGPEVLLQPLASAGLEVAFGCVRDPQFGPLVMLSAGGTMIEFLDDRCFALAPFGVGQARRLIARLKLYPLLLGARGRPPCDLEELAEALARFSVLCAELAEVLAEADVNPLIVDATGPLAVDGVMIAG